MKILTEILKLQLHEDLHKNVMFSFTFYANFQEFLWWAI